MKTDKVLKWAYAARVIGRELFSEGRPGARAAVKLRRHAWVARGAARNPFLVGFGGAFLGLVAFSLVLMALGAVFALVGLVLKLALAVGAVYLLLRYVRHFRRPGTQIVIVPPDARASRPRS